MTPLRVVTSTSGPRITVNGIIKDPLVIPTRVLRITKDRFIADKILRPAGNAPSGVVQYWESDPIYADDTDELVNEFAEIPVAQTSIGTPQTVRTRKSALAVVISEEMRIGNRIDLVMKQTNQVRNTLVKSVDGRLMQAIRTNPSINTRASTTAWGLTNATVRRDVNAARKLITDLQREYNPDTLILSASGVYDFLNSDEIAKPYVGNVAGENVQITGELPGQFMGLSVMWSFQVATGEAFVLEQGTVGGIADRRELQSTELYRHNPTETYRSDSLRDCAGFLDEPGAITRLTGV